MHLIKNPSTNKTLMIIGAAEEQCLGIKAAHEMGLKVFVTDGNPCSPGFSMADAFAVASTYDCDATLKAAQHYIATGGRIDGVMTLAADVPLTVAYITNKLRLPGINIQSAINASDKIRMKECFQRAGLPIPSFQEIKNEQDLRKAKKKFCLPVIVKPVDSRGARGVQLISEWAMISKALKIAQSYSPTKRAMIEEYLPGPQLSTEGFILDGKAYIPAIFDRNYEYLDRFAPYIIENGGEMPSIYTTQFHDEIHSIMKRAAIALGIKNSIIKGDLVIHEGKIKIIEIALRMSGGFFGTIATPASCGVDILKANIRLSLGINVNPSDLKCKFKKAAAIRFAFPESGKIKSVSGLETVLSDPHCCYANIFAKEGDFIAPISNHPGRPAVVVANGSDINEAINNAKKLIKLIKFEIEST